MKQLIFKCNGHTFMLRYRAEDGPWGADEAIQAWVDNPEIDFSQSDMDALKDRLHMIGMVQGLFGP